MKTRESWLEVGLLTFVIAITGAAGVAIVGRSTGSARRKQRHSLPPPASGSLPAGSHHNVSSSAAR